MFGENFQFSECMKNKTFTPEMLKKIAKIFAIKNSTESTFLLNYDESIIQTISGIKSETECLVTLATAFDFLDSLNFESDNPTIAETLRKLIALGFFSQKIWKNEKFIPELIKYVNFLYEYLKKSSEYWHESSFALSFALSSISPFINNLDFKGQLFDFFDKIENLFHLPKFLDYIVIPFYFDFFISAFFSLRNIEDDIDQQNFLKEHLLNTLISTISMDIIINYNFMEVISKIFHLMNSKKLSIELRADCFRLLNSIASKYENIQTILVNSENAILICDFFYNYLSDVSFPLSSNDLTDQTKSIKMLEYLPEINDPVLQFIEPFFKDQYISQLHKINKKLDIFAPECPAEISNLNSIVILQTLISQFCRSLTFQPFQINHMVFMREFLKHPNFWTVPIAPFFVALWASKLITNTHILSNLSDFLQDIKFFKTMLNISFLKYNNQELRTFVLSLFYYFMSVSPNAKLMKDVLIHFEKSIVNMKINENILGCITVIASMNNSLFIDVCKQIKFVKKLKEYMILYQMISINKDSKAYEIFLQNQEQIMESRRLLLNFIDKISNENEIFEYLFTKNDYVLAVLSHLFDTTTIDFAISHSKLAIAKFNNNYLCIRLMFKFFVTKIFTSINTPYIVLNKIIDLCIYGFEKNPYTIGKIFSDSNFFEDLVNFLIKINATECIEKILELLKLCSTVESGYNPNIEVFLKLSPLIKSAKNMSLTDYLFQMVFGDNNLKSVENTSLTDYLFQNVFSDIKTNKLHILNPAPLAILFQIFKDNTKLLTDFIKFIQTSLTLSMYEVATTSLPSQIIKFLSEFRNPKLIHEKNELFYLALNFLTEIMMYSISPHDFISFFQLLTILPGNLRPFYTLDLINTLRKVFKMPSSINSNSLSPDLGNSYSFSNPLQISSTSTPLAFFNIETKDKGIFIPSIPIEVLNNGFTLSIHIQILDRSGTIFSFSNNNDSLNLSFSSENLLSFNGLIYDKTLPLMKWIVLTFCFYKTGELKILMNNQEIIQYKINKTFNNNLDHNVIASYLKCNIEFIKLEYNQQILFQFSAYSCYKNYAVDNSIVAKVDGTLIHLPQSPKDVLSAIGGGSVLIPLFAQIDLPISNQFTHNNELEIQPNNQSEITDEMKASKFTENRIECSNQEKEQLLISILSLIESTLNGSSQLQNDFYSSHCFRAIAELLSVTSVDVLTEDVISKLFDILKVLSNKKLQKQMIEYVFFNLNIWIFVVKIHDFFFPKLFEVVLQLLSTDSFFLSIINVRGILFLMKCYLYTKYDEATSLGNGSKETLDGRILAERPTDLSKVRSYFLNFLVKLCDNTFTENDLNTIFYFCFDDYDTEFQCCIIILLKELILKKNMKLIRLLNHLNGIDDSEYHYENNLATKEGISDIFNDFFKLFSFHNYRLIASTIALLDAAVNAGITLLTIPQIIQKILISLDSINVTFNLYQRIEKMKISQSFKVPIYLYIIIKILDGTSNSNDEEEMNKSNQLKQIFDSLLNTESNLFENNDNEYYFYLFLLCLYPKINNDDSNISKSNKELYNYFAKAICMLCLVKEDPLSKVKYFTEIIEQKTQNDLSIFLRHFFESYLNCQIPQKQMGNIIITIYSYLFRIPEFDSYYYVDAKFKNLPLFSFIELYNILKFENQSTITFNTSFGSRTNSEQEWLDANIALKLLDKILPKIEYICELTYICCYGIMHRASELNFLAYCGKILSLFKSKNPEGNNQHLKISFIMFFGCLSTVYLHGHQTTFLFHILESELNNYKTQAINLIQPKSEIHDLVKDLSPLFAERLSQIEYKMNLNLCTNYSIELLSNTPSKITSLFSNESTEFMKYTANIFIPSEQIQTSIKNFSVFLKKSKRESMKTYKELLQKLSTDNGPWSAPEKSTISHYKLEINNIKRTKMIPNLKYDDHKQASLVRDLGSFENAQAQIREQLAKMKLKSFAGDFSLIDFDDIEEIEKPTIDQQTQTNTSKIIIKCQAQLITPMKVHSGELSLTKDFILFESDKKYVKISMKKIKLILLRRYLMIDSSIEIFCYDFTSFFLNFVDSNQRFKFITKVSSLKISNIKLIQRKKQDIHGMLVKLTRNWQNGNISNYDYLLKLNLLAGRSFNDLSQYPIFPWVISNYTSETIDLEDPSIYRDFSKPVGAMVESRIKILREKMNESISDDTYYLFGSLYSSSAVVEGYLIRMEPFTSLHITLHSGRFDIADRLFISIPQAWESVRHTDMDFRELIPEFFVNPEFLSNSNNFDLGKSVNDDKVSNVILPPWAKTPREFIEIHRSALESRYVSAHLHEWIDLMFGPHSRLPLSKEADNIFHPYFYDETMNAALAQNDEGKIALIKEYAACFGSCPLQLFDQIPEPRNFTKLSIDINLDMARKLKFEGSKIISLCSDNTYKAYNNQNQTNSSKKFPSVIAVFENLQYAFIDQNERAKYGKLILTVPKELEKVNPIIAPTEKYMILAVPWSTSFSIYIRNKGGNTVKVQDIYPCSQPISSIAATSKYFATASNDCTLRIWKYIDKTTNFNPRNDNMHAKLIGFLAKHVRPIKFIEISERLNAVYSLSSDGFISHVSLHDGTYVRGIDLGYSEPSHFVLSKNGYIVTVFNGPDSSNIIIIDQNLEEIKKFRFDNAIQCLTVLYKCGRDYIAIVTKTSKFEILDLPYLDKVECSINCLKDFERITYLSKPKPQIFIANKFGNIFSLDVF